MSVPDNQNQLEGLDKGPAFLLHREGFSIDDYTLVERIGEGTFGEVWKAERAGFPVALKILKTTVNSEETQRELESLEKLKKLHHKYLLHTQNFWSDGDRLFIEMELADGGSLKERLKAYRDIGKNAIPEDELLKYFTEVGKALDYMHGHRPVFLHRDIKPANILLVQGSAKLADFGLLRQVSGDNSSTKTQGGTFPYMAPESIKDDRFSVHTDLFAFAVTYTELRQGSLPFPGNNQFQICQKILDDPPKLSDVFDPEERKVVLKALAKDPGERFSSCGEFVFELNRVVPWLPATTIFVFPPAPKPEPAVPANTKGSTGKSARPVEHGTSRKNSPTTMNEIDLPPGEAAPGASTVSKKAGTVVGTGTRGAKPGTGNTTQKPLASQTPKVDPAAPASVAKPKPIPMTAPEPIRPTATVSKVPAKALVAAVLLAILVSGVTGIWLLANRAGNDDIRKMIDDKKFSEAAKKLDGAAGMDAEIRERYRKEVESKWWAEIPRQVAKGESALATQRKDVQDFLTYFKSHAEANALRDEIDARIEPAPDGFHDYLTQAWDKLAAKRYTECLADLLAAKKIAATERNRHLVDAKLVELRERLVKEFADQRPTKVNADAVLNARKNLYPFLRDKNIPWPDDFQDKLDADEVLALTYVGRTDAAFQLYADLLRRGKNTLLQDQTVLFIGLIPGDRELTAITLKSGTSNVPPKELHLLNQLAAANGSNPKAQTEAVGVLIGLMGEMPAKVNQAMWPALASLEEKSRLLRFADLFTLDNALAIAPDADASRKAIAQILGSVLERKVKAANYSWRANAKEKASCLAWIQRIEAPADCLLALKAECLAEPGGSVKDLSEISFPLQADWYGSYVQALALEKQGKLPDAADVIAVKLKGQHAVLKPAERADKSLQILRGAVRSLQHKAGKDSKHFADEADAKRAILWLTAVFDFAGAAKDDNAVDDAIALAFAAVKTGDGKPLEVAAGRLDKAGSAAGYYWLAKAYDAEGKSPAKVLSYFEKMLDAKAPAPDALRNAAAAEGGRLALQWAKEKLKAAKVKSDNSKWTEADAFSKLGEKFALALGKENLPAAARLYGEAVEVQAYAMGKNAPGNGVDKKYAEEMYGIYERAIQKAQGGAPARSVDFRVPVTIAKLAFVSDLFEGEGLTEAHLLATEKEGKEAVRVAQNLVRTVKAPQEEAAWQSLYYQGVVKLADVRMHLLIRYAKDGKLDRVNNPKYVRAKCEEIRTGFELARKAKKYAEKYDGEFAFKIGTMFYQTCDLTDQSKTDMMRETKEAVRELSASRQSLNESKMTPERRRETGAAAALTAVDEMLKILRE